MRLVFLPVPYTDDMFMIRMPTSAVDDPLTYVQEIVLAMHKRIEELEAEIDLLKAK